MTLALPDLLPAGLRRSWAADGTCPDLDLYSLFRARQIADPHRTAVIDGKGKLCYTALDRKARCLAAGLSGLGIRAGDVVGVQLPSGRHAVVADLALAALGAVALPFPVGRGGREAASLLRRSEAVAVLAATEHRGAHHAADLLALAGELPHLRTVVATGTAAEVPAGAVALSALLRDGDPAAFTPVRPDPDRAARILVSSGSEAEPKMVAYSHNALAGGRGNFLASLMPDGTPPRCLFLVPLASAFGSNGTAVALARHGGTLVLLDHFTPEAALDALVEHRPTHVLGVPTMVRMLLDRITSGDATRPELPSPTALVVGGSPLDEATAAEARRVFGCPVVNLYGSADGVNCHTGLDARPVQEEHAAGVLAGRPDARVAEIRIAVPDAPGLVEAPVGAVGEIVARGPMTPLCYVAAPDLDARYRTADGWVRTGDLGRLDEDGTLRVVGRLKDVVIRGGANISPAEVEVELAAHPLVRDVVCVGVPDPLMGERLAACVVASTARPPTLAELSAHLDARGLERRKHPEQLLVVRELPLTPAGKPDRPLLRKRLGGAFEDIDAGRPSLAGAV
ncbi:AMP-binding protein [Streptomyces sp. NPDC059009]|uniref:AMP-binding protein n=1 Tax=Streptomyces sp. NPDC059009 TaxID=3346694 RepID=UPI00369FE8E0